LKSQTDNTLGMYTAKNKLVQMDVIGPPASANGFQACWCTPVNADIKNRNSECVKRCYFEVKKCLNKFSEEGTLPKSEAHMRISDTNEPYC